MLQPYDDNYFMKQALLEAQKAFEKDEVPVGAVLVSKNKIIARTHNLTEQLTDFTAHAEMQAFTAGSSFLDNKYLNECTLYVTLEPCVMCAGAAFWTRLGRLFTEPVMSEEVMIELLKRSFIQLLKSREVLWQTNADQL